MAHMIVFLWHTRDTEEAIIHLKKKREFSLKWIICVFFSFVELIGKPVKCQCMSCILAQTPHIFHNMTVYSLFACSTQ